MTPKVNRSTGLNPPTKRGRRRLKVLIPAALSLVALLLGIIYCMTAKSHHDQVSGGGQARVTIVFRAPGAADGMAMFALRQLQDHLVSTAGVAAPIVAESLPPQAGQVRLEIDPHGVGASSTPESFRLTAGKDGSLKIVGADGAGLLWGVRDFQHYYCQPWLDALAAGKALEMDIVSSPTIQNRGLWTWQYGCYDPYAYIDRASEWKLNAIIFWNRGVPMDADRLAAYAHERGVKIWWGFSWGWVAADFLDASPELAERLMALYEKQKRQIGPELGNLDLLAPETPPALKEYVLDVFEKQYAWIPEIDGIYFQSATEVISPRLSGKTEQLGEALVSNILPIMEELHRRYPRLKISCGIHNTGDYATYKALEKLPPYCNIMWEAGVTWAPSREIARKQMQLRGANEDFGGIYRITMNCGMVFQDNLIRGEKDRVWLGRVEKLWDYLEEGQPEGSGQGFKSFQADGKEVGYPCTSDWRPPAGKRLLDNRNFQELLGWSRELAQGPPRTKGIFLLVEAGLIDLKMRRVPAMAAETIWNPLVDEAELERRCRTIWEQRVGAWRKPINPYWQARAAGQQVAPETSRRQEDLGEVYDRMSR